MIESRSEVINLRSVTLFLLLVCGFSMCQGQSGFLITGTTSIRSETFPRYSYKRTQIRPDFAYQFGRNHLVGVSGLFTSVNSPSRSESEKSVVEYYYKYLHWLNDKLAISGGARYKSAGHSSDVGDYISIGLEGGLLYRLTPNFDLRIHLVDLPFYQREEVMTAIPEESSHQIVAIESGRIGLFDKVSGQVQLAWRPQKWMDGFDSVKSKNTARPFVSVYYQYEVGSRREKYNGLTRRVDFESELCSFDVGLFVIDSYVLGVKTDLAFFKLDPLQFGRFDLMPMVRMVKPLSHHISYYGEIYLGPQLGSGADIGSDYRGGVNAGLLLKVYKSFALEMDLFKLRTFASFGGGTRMDSSLRVADFATSIGLNYSF